MKILIDNKEVVQEDYTYNSVTKTITFKSLIGKYAQRQRKWWQFWKPRFANYIQIIVKM